MLLGETVNWLVTIMRISIQFLNERYYLIVVSLQFLFDSKGSISFRKKIRKKNLKKKIPIHT